MKTRLTTLAMALLIVTGASPASADSFVLRPPSILDLDFESNFFFFVSDGFSATQVFDPTTRIFFGANPGCDPCAVGDTFDPSFTVTNTLMGSGSAKIGNTDFSDVSFFGDLSFAATPLAFPAAGVNGILLTTPFTFTGTLRGFEGNQLAFSVAVTGAGFASRQFDCCFGDGRFVAGENRLSYIFSAAAGPVPEPASALLLATGIAGVVARRRATRASPSR